MVHMTVNHSYFHFKRKGEIIVWAAIDAIETSVQYTNHEPLKRRKLCYCNDIVVM